MKNYMISLLTATFVMGCSSTKVVDESINDNVNSADKDNVIAISEVISTSSDTDRLMRSVAIYFETDSSEIPDSYKGTLKKVSQALSHEPDLKLYIHGHADERGDKKYNIELSKLRGAAILKALALEKETYKRTSLDFFGEDNPRCEVDTKNDLSCNRRVDIYLVK